LRIETYFQQIQETIQSCPVVQLSDISYNKRGSYEGFIRGELYFVDESKLHLREFVDVETSPDRVMYAYQYVNASNSLIFRYDNTGHHRKLGLHTYPHHKHDGSEDNVVSSPGPDLFQVLKEIESLVKLP
jgi:hypothetical protein